MRALFAIMTALSITFFGAGNALSLEEIEIRKIETGEFEIPKNYPSNRMGRRQNFALVRNDVKLPSRAYFVILETERNFFEIRESIGAVGGGYDISSCGKMPPEKVGQRPYSKLERIQIKIVNQAHEKIDIGEKLFIPIYKNIRIYKLKDNILYEWIKDAYLSRDLCVFIKTGVMGGPQYYIQKINISEILDLEWIDP